MKLLQIVLMASALWVNLAVAQTAPVMSIVGTASGAVNSLSKSSAASSGAGMAFSSTQSGVSAMFGQFGASEFTNGATVIGTAATPGYVGINQYMPNSITGYTSTNQFVTSTSMSQGNAVGSSNSLNAGIAATSSKVTGAFAADTTGASLANLAGNSLSQSSGSAGTLSANGGGTTVVATVPTGLVQGNSSSNTGLYQGTAGLVSSTGTATVGSITAPLVPLKVLTGTTYSVANNIGTVTPGTTFGAVFVANSPSAAGSLTNFSSVINNGLSNNTVAILTPVTLTNIPIAPEVAP